MGQVTRAGQGSYPSPDRPTCGEIYRVMEVQGRLPVSPHARIARIALLIEEDKPLMGIGPSAREGTGVSVLLLGAQSEEAGGSRPSWGGAVVDVGARTCDGMVCQSRHRSAQRAGPRATGLKVSHETFIGEAACSARCGVASRSRTAQRLLLACPSGLVVQAWYRRVRLGYRCNCDDMLCEGTVIRTNKQLHSQRGTGGDAGPNATAGRGSRSGLWKARED